MQLRRAMPLLLFLLAGPLCGQTYRNTNSLDLGAVVQWTTQDYNNMYTIPQMNLQWVRLPISWWDVQPNNPSQWDWSISDTWVNTANTLGLKIYANLADVPSWACRSGQQPGTCAPADVNQWTAFVTAATNRYCGKVNAINFYNEPNLPSGWQSSDVDYVESVFIPGAQAIRDTGCNVIIAAGEVSTMGGSQYDAIFSDLDSLGRTDLVDVIAVHVYGGPGGGPDAIVQRGFEVQVQLDCAWYVDDYGFWVCGPSVWAWKPLWMTEFGFDQGGNSSYSGYGYDVLRTIQEYGPRYRWFNLFNYKLIDSGGESKGLLYANGSWKWGAHLLQCCQ